MNRTYKTEGIVLKRANLGEADRILTLYTKHYGKIKVIAKGVRKITSRKSGNIQLFNHLALLLARGRNLDIVSEVQVINSFESWRKDLRKIGQAYYFCELIDKLTPESQASRTVFELLNNSLKNIGVKDSGQLAKAFEECLLARLGFGIPLNLDENQSDLRGYIEEIIERKINSPKIISSF